MIDNSPLSAPPSPVYRVVLPSGTVWLSCLGSSYVVRYPAPGIFWSVMTGHGHAAFCPYLKQELDQAIAAKAPILLFADAYDLLHYDVEFRLFWTKELHQPKCVVGPCHILLRSRIVAMGVSVMSLALGAGAMIPHTHRDTFEAALQAAIRAHEAGLHPPEGS